MCMGQVKSFFQIACQYLVQFSIWTNRTVGGFFSSSYWSLKMCTPLVKCIVCVWCVRNAVLPVNCMKNWKQLAKCLNLFLPAMKMWFHDIIYSTMLLQQFRASKKTAEFMMCHRMDAVVVTLFEICALTLERMNQASGNNTIFLPSKRCTWDIGGKNRERMQWTRVMYI